MLGWEFTTGDAAVLSGLAPKTIANLVDRGVVVPEIAEAHGAGSRRLFSLWNVVELGVVDVLRSLHLPERVTRPALDMLRRSEVPDIVGFWLQLAQEIGGVRQREKRDKIADKYTKAKKQYGEFRLVFLHDRAEPMPLYTTNMKEMKGLLLPLINVAPGVVIINPLAVFLTVVDRFKLRKPE